MGAEIVHKLLDLFEDLIRYVLAMDNLLVSEQSGECIDLIVFHLPLKLLHPERLHPLLEFLGPPLHEPIHLVTNLIE